MADDNKHKHLDMIQGVINRMAGNSALFKGWTVTLVAALFALADKDTNRHYLYIAIIPTVMFWILDGYYLWQERMYRDLYNVVRVKDENTIDYDLKATGTWDQIWAVAIFRPVNLVFYLTILALELFFIWFVK